MGENFFGQNIFGPPITLPCPTYNHHLFTPPSSVIFKDECYGRTKDELTDRTHTRIVSFIVLDLIFQHANGVLKSFAMLGEVSY